MDSEPSKTSKRKVSALKRYQQNPVPMGKSSATLARGKGPVLSGPGQMVNRGSSKADRLQSTSRRLDLDNVADSELIMDATPAIDSSKDKADLGFGGSVNRAQHGSNEEGPAKVTRKRAASTEAHNASEYRGGPGDLGLNFEYNMKVIRQLECRNLITSQFREKLLTWFCLRAVEQDRRVLNAFIKTLKDDLGSLAGQLEHSFGGINYTDR